MIQLEHISKQFRLYRHPVDRLKEIVFRRQYHTVHQALNNISFTVPDGKTLGIIGQNGAGKSTLLKILTGILLPDDGSVTLSGRVTGLLELGTGFNLEASGLDNIRNNATLLGMLPAEIQAKRERIIAFAELGAFIHEPMHTYSSGMVMRLGFAIAIHADPACFIVDEALSVGDAYFQQKCMRAIQTFREQGGSVILVSHDLNAVRVLCDQAILLDAGNIIEQGTPKAVVDYYHGLMLSKSHQGDTPVAIRRPMNEPNTRSAELGDESVQPPAVALPPLAGTGEIEVLELIVRNAHGQMVSYVTSEEIMTIIAVFRSQRDLDSPHFGIGLRNRLGQTIFETNSSCVGMSPPPLAAGECVHVEWTFVANLKAGHYAITLGVANRAHSLGDFDETLFFAHDLLMIEVGINPDAIRYDGYFNMHPQFTLKSYPGSSHRTTT